jgi:nicotinamide riboside transporter PnuC
VLPLADSANTFFGILIAVVMVSGYVIIWALWHFVFRHAPPDDRSKIDE